MKSKKIISFAMAAVTAGTLLTGCGGQKGGEAGASQEKPGESTEAVEEKVELSVTTWDNDSSPQFSAVIKAYEEAHPNVSIKVIDTAANEYNNSLTISLSAAQPDPDVMWVKDPGAVIQMAKKNQLLSLDEYIKRDSYNVEKYNGLLDEMKYDGGTYSLPYRKDWYLLFYNKDLFDAAGVEYPSNDMTWAEYDALAEKMTSGDGSAKVYGSYNHTWQELVTNWAVQDGKNSVVAKDYSFLKPFYEEHLALQDKGYILDYSMLKTGNLHFNSVFKSQQCAMMPMGTWFIATMLKSQAEGETDFQWGIAKIPHPEDVEAGYTVGSVTPIAVSAYTDHPEESWEFVKFATSEEAAEILAGEGVLAGVQTQDAIDKITSNQYFPEGESNVKALDYTHYALHRPLDENIAEIKVVLDEVHDMIMTKQYTIDDGIKELNERVASIKGW